MQEPLWRISEWFPDLDATALNKLKTYHELLVRTNPALNLVSKNTIAFADNAHFADSLVSSKIVHEKFNNIEYLYDIGSGNGFPGLVFAILFPTIEVRLLDSDIKKCEFLKMASHRIGAKNVKVLNMQLERLPQESIFSGISRGFAALNRAAGLLYPVTKKDGSVWFLKSAGWEDEVAGIDHNKWEVLPVQKYALPETNIQYFIVGLKKR